VTRRAAVVSGPVHPDVYRPNGCRDQEPTDHCARKL